MNQSTTYSNLITMRSGKQREGLQQLIDDLPCGLVMAEVGCYAGESTEMFLLSGKIDQLFAIDPYQVWEDENDPTTKSDLQLAEKTFITRTTYYRQKGHLIKMKCKLSEALRYISEINFIYLDGDHRYESVKTDIRLSLGLIKNGGFIAGHNYTDFPGVRKAVDEVIGRPTKIYIDSSWIKILQK